MGILFIAFSFLLSIAHEFFSKIWHFSRKRRDPPPGLPDDMSIPVTSMQKRPRTINADYYNQYGLGKRVSTIIFSVR